ncbi:MAG: class I tRNA ligase family protein, partial [Parcubacteria group bacterium]|nr:class I tRNA ligase family protein [Parcubacteria group bacterium]
EEDLPVLLPDVKDFRPTGTDKSPLATVKDFVRTKCPKCGGEARRETDVSDTFLDSAWYYLRYPSVRMQNSKIKMQNYNIKSKTTEIPWNHEITKRWLPVDMYIGGAEHAVLHLLYTRFLTKVFHDWGLVDFDEPFKKFRAHGLLIKDGAKMSKSKGNVVNPDEYIEAWGADTMRMYLMFLGPFAQGGDFRDSGIVGAARFLKRVWEFVNEKIKTKNAALQKAKKAPEEVTRILHQSIKKITDDISGLRYNTAIAQLMILLNAFEKDRTEVGKEELRVFLKLLAPLAPFLAEELWHVCGAPASESVHTQPWPAYDPSRAQETTQTIAIQINGKLRDTITLPRDADQVAQKTAALANEKVRIALSGKPPHRVIVVAGRLVNIVL